MDNEDFKFVEEVVEVSIDWLTLLKRRSLADIKQVNKWEKALRQAIQKTSPGKELFDYKLPKTMLVTVIWVEEVIDGALG